MCCGLPLFLVGFGTQRHPLRFGDDETSYLLVIYMNVYQLSPIMVNTIGNFHLLRS